MKKIFALQGKANSGKTATFYLLGQFMQNFGYIILEGNLLERLARHSRRGDFWQIFEKDGILIGVVSAGDLYKIVKQQLNSLIQNHHCVIILCTCRSYDKKTPGTVAAINEVSGYEKEFIRKEWEPDPSKFDASNQGCAEVLFNMLESYLNFNGHLGNE